LGQFLCPAFGDRTEVIITPLRVNGGCIQYWSTLAVILKPPEHNTTFLLNINGRCSWVNSTDEIFLLILKDGHAAGLTTTCLPFEIDFLLTTGHVTWFIQMNFAYE
jgi:hypothetical protein